MFANVVCGWQGVQQHFLKLFSHSNNECVGITNVEEHEMEDDKIAARTLLKEKKCSCTTHPSKVTKNNTATSIQDDLCCSRWCGTHCAAHFKEAG